MSDSPDPRPAVPAQRVRVHTSLAAAVNRAVLLLGDPRTPHVDVTSGRLEGGLRHEVDRLCQDGRAPGPLSAAHPAVAAVRAACAHLSTRALEDAYLALLVARGLLVVATRE